MTLPGGSGGIGFDDLVFAPSMRKILVPSAARGALDIVDPETMHITAVAGFRGRAGAYQGGHGEGTTSADEGPGVLFAVDRTSGLLDVVDPAASAILASVPLRGGPDYVRWVGASREVWVTEPDRQVIEVFSFSSDPKPAVVHSLDIPVAGGPESLVVDSARKRAFANLWSGKTVAIDLAAHAVVATWPNGCDGSRGIALDGARGFLMVGCHEGKLVNLDIDHDGRQLGTVSAGSGVDIIAYADRLRHAYLPGASSATMAIVDVAATGGLTVLATVPTAPHAHCVAADDRGYAWVCDPEHGTLHAIRDTF